MQANVEDAVILGATTLTKLRPEAVALIAPAAHGGFFVVCIQTLGNFGASFAHLWVDIPTMVARYLT
jgi:hypothetical protein